MSGNPKKCRNCGTESVYCTGGRCPPCFRHFMDHNVERPLPTPRPAPAAKEPAPAAEKEAPVAETQRPAPAPLDPEESLRFVLALYKDADLVRKALEAQLVAERARADKLAADLDKEKQDGFALLERLQAAEDKVKELESQPPKKPEVTLAPDLQREITTLFAERQQG